MIVWYAGLITLIVVVLIVLLSLYFGLSKPSSAAAKEIITGLYKIRSVYFIVLVIAIVGVLSITMTSKSIPYHELHQGNADVTVEVKASRWSWSFNTGGSEQLDLTVPTGKLIEFKVSSDNVNHGFGIYSPDGNLLTQVQVMPGYTNRLRYTFDKPGEYHVICLEYCGKQHHSMMTSFNVK